jgi:uracil-DNA glycosylase family 4
VVARGKKIPCDVLFIGEAPGPSEDILGRPFEGPAGHLLDSIIDKSLPEEISYAMTNLVCCIPKINGEKKSEPGKVHIEACSDRLKEFIEIAQPKLIVRVGSLSKKYCPDVGVPYTTIIHPSAIIQSNVAVQELLTSRAIATIRTSVMEIVNNQDS